MSGSVAPVRATLLTHRLLLRQLLTRGRVIALVVLGAITILATLGVALNDETTDKTQSTIEVIDGLGLVLVVPIVSLVFASASLGDGREDGTLVYLWLRPMDRLPVVLGAYLASLTISLPLTVVPLTVASLVGGAEGAAVTATIAAAVAGVIAYSALFVLVGLMVKNAIIWGLAYVLLWEGVFTQFSETIGQASVRGYVRTALSNLADVPLRDVLDTSTVTSLIVLAVIAAASIAVASMRLERMEID